ncbi:Centromere protein X like protein [Argiope bruennichi]|uniref:Centromere protein X n=1 Tax=Argiope bruennichi TaxID=94029 RepID=A0A8T0EVC2_ARGBR|nr:Centromere protein X like protein [Argiope bruennichi]
MTRPDQPIMFKMLNLESPVKLKQIDDIYWLRDPFRCLIDELLEDILNLHTYCLIFDEIRRQKEATEGTKWKRRIAKVTGKDAKLEPLSVIVYQDNAFEIRRKVEKLEFYFNDLKSRYLWAQNHISEQNILRARNRRISKAEYQNLSEVWHETEKQEDIFKNSHDPKCSTNLSKIPDRFRSSRSKLSNILFSLISSQKAAEGRGDDSEEEAIAIDNRMHIITLLEEIQERDEYIVQNDAVKLVTEVVRIFITECAARAAIQAQSECIGESDIIPEVNNQHLEKILPQLLLDF